MAMHLNNIVRKGIQFSHGKDGYPGHDRRRNPTRGGDVDGKDIVSKGRSACRVIWAG